jgi:hypothetical protein
MLTCITPVYSVYFSNKPLNVIYKTKYERNKTTVAMTKLTNWCGRKEMQMKLGQF